ncbi:hypothetical protein ABLE91_23570 [Aquabacter sp. CN5-332]|uniref:hypothetical protein n=1 Tax=Aquabacter sp. CN5-332 TaxID=3156608 RepID=UPI0032B48C7C
MILAGSGIGQGVVMSAERRNMLKLVKSGEPYGAPESPLAPHSEAEPAITAKLVLVALFIALVATGVSYGFFDWLAAWVHGLVFLAAFAFMLLFGRRMACSD